MVVGWRQMIEMSPTISYIHKMNKGNITKQPNVALQSCIFRGKNLYSTGLKQIEKINATATQRSKVYCDI